MELQSLSPALCPNNPSCNHPRVASSTLCCPHPLASIPENRLWKKSRVDWTDEAHPRASQNILGPPCLPYPPPPLPSLPVPPPWRRFHVCVARTDEQERGLYRHMRATLSPRRKSGYSRRRVETIPLGGRRFSAAWFSLVTTCPFATLASSFPLFRALSPWEAVALASENVISAGTFPASSEGKVSLPAPLSLWTWQPDSRREARYEIPGVSRLSVDSWGPASVVDGFTGAVPLPFSIHEACGCFLKNSEGASRFASVFTPRLDIFIEEISVLPCEPASICWRV